VVVRCRNVARFWCYASMMHEPDSPSVSVTAATLHRMKRMRYHGMASSLLGAGSPFARPSCYPPLSISPACELLLSVLPHVATWPISSSTLNDSTP